MSFIKPFVTNYVSDYVAGFISPSSIVPVLSLNYNSNTYTVDSVDKTFAQAQTFTRSTVAKYITDLGV